MKDAKARLRRKKIYSVFDLGRLPVTDEHGKVVNREELPPEPKTLAGYIARELAVQQAKATAQRKAEDDAARTSYETRLREFWSQPVSQLVGRLGMRDDHCPLEVCASDPNAGSDFLAELASRGVVLTTEAKNRVAAYAESQNTHSHGRIGVTVTNLQRAFERIRSLGCFADGEVSEPSPVIDAPVEQEPNLGELFARANDSPQADRELRSVIAGMVNVEIREVLWAWQRSVYENFSHKLTELQLREAWRFVQDHNLNPLKPASWDAARRSLVSRSLLSDACLTCREVLERQYREGSISHREFLGRCRTLEIEGVLDKPRHAAA